MLLISHALLILARHSLSNRIATGFMAGEGLRFGMAEAKYRSDRGDSTLGVEEPAYRAHCAIELRRFELALPNDKDPPSGTTQVRDLKFVALRVLPELSAPKRSSGRWH
jgi:hypothetical protein